jgi:hypothetical protein
MIAIELIAVCTRSDWAAGVFDAQNTILTDQRQFGN